MVETDLFLSHDWGVDEKGRNNHERVAIVNEQLKGLGYSTWFDSERMIGNISKQMASGIENSQMVLVFLTQRYHDKVNGEDPSDNCKLEFMHAARRKTSNRMICLVMESRMRNTANWLGEIGMYLAGKLYIDLSGDFNSSYLKEQLALLQQQFEGMKIVARHQCSKEAVVISSDPTTSVDYIKFRLRGVKPVGGWAWDVGRIKVFDLVKKKLLVVKEYFDSGCVYYDNPKSYDCYHVRHAFSDGKLHWGGRKSDYDDSFYLGGEVEFCEEYEVRMEQVGTHVLIPPEGKCFLDVFRNDKWAVITEMDIDPDTKAAKCVFKL